MEKFQTLQKIKGLNKQALADEFGKISKHNDKVDATLLHALRIGVSDFLVTQDQGLHDRAQKHSADLARRVLFVADAAQLLEITYEPREVPILHVDEVSLIRFRLRIHSLIVCAKDIPNLMIGGIRNALGSADLAG